MEDHEAEGTSEGTASVCRDWMRVWDERNNTAKPQGKKHRDIFMDPQLGKQSEGLHFLLLPHLHGAQQTSGNNFTANMTLFNHIVMVQLRITA